jgi:GNAT superfamily N-acetyltransferase
VIAEADDKPGGVAPVRRHPDGSRELASLVVLAQYRGHGIAARMVDELLSEATDHRSADSPHRWMRRLGPGARVRRSLSAAVLAGGADSP